MVEPSPFAWIPSLNYSVVCKELEEADYMIYFYELADKPELYKALEEQFMTTIFPTVRDRHITQASLETIPEVVTQYVKRSGLQVDNSKFFYLAAHNKTMVHTDKVGRECALNIPVTFSGEGGLMRWFNQQWNETIWVKDNEQYARLASEKNFSFSDERLSAQEIRRNIEFTKDAIPAASLVIQRPTIVRVNEWHDADNSRNTEFRVMYSLRFHSNPSFEELVQRFKDL